MNEDCARNAHRLMGIPWQRTQDCIKKAFSLDGKDVNIEDGGDAVQLRDKNIVNTMIDAEMLYYDRHGPQLYPAVVINNQTFRGQLEVEAVFNAVCAGFYTVPPYCKKFLETNDVNKVDLMVMELQGQQSRFLKILRLALLVTCCLAPLFYCYRRSAKREMQTQMKEQVESAVN